MVRNIWIATLPVVIVAGLWAQEPRKDRGIFVETTNAFYEMLEDSADAYLMPADTVEKEFQMDFGGKVLPVSVDQFNYQWHLPAESQGITGTCWSFATTSFFESEIFRIHKKEIDLSEMYTVYWEYVEKARRYVQERGNSLFAEGSMSNAVIRIWKKYGIVPQVAYPGLQSGQRRHDHRNMYREMNGYLEHCREVNFWNEEDILGNIKSILNYYMDEPPLNVIVDGQEMSPLVYLNKIVDLELDDYVDILSLKEKPYYARVEYPVPDNWWHSEEYYNVPLDEFMAVIKSALRDKYTLVIGGDVSEAGYDSHYEVALVPTFDIPPDHINEDARQFRFSNGSTTDDHGIHMVGWTQIDGRDWYLIRDSGSGARNGPNIGYRFYHEDYVKLKMMEFMVHRDAAREVLGRRLEIRD